MDELHQDRTLFGPLRWLMEGQPSGPAAGAHRKYSPAEPPGDLEIHAILLGALNFCLMSELRQQSPRAVAVLGAGKMGEILARGISRSGLVPPDQIYLADVNAQRSVQLAELHGFQVAESNVAAAGAANIILLAVKPQDVETVLRQIDPVIGSDHLLVSIAAGVTTARIEWVLASDCRVVRAMPNAASAVGEGITAICAGSSADSSDLDVAEQMLSGAGKVLRISERYIDAVTAVSGSGPAYFALFAEAMVDAGVSIGLARTIATELVVQTMVGTAAMLAQGGMHPLEIREAVTSPGGTTAMALRELERAGVRAGVSNAIQAALDRARALAAADPEVKN